MFGYINTGRVNIRIHRDIEGKMWFGVGKGSLCTLNRGFKFVLKFVEII